MSTMRYTAARRSLRWWSMIREPMERGCSLLALAALFCALVPSTGVALPTDHKQLEKNKDVVERFFQVANGGKVDELKAIVREDYIEHADMLDFRDGLAKSIASNPGTPVKASYEEERQRIRGDIVRMIAERDHVWTYSAVQGPESLVARLDMFRLSGDQIAEHWAVVQQVPAKRPHNNDPFALGRGPHDYKTQPKRISRVTSQKEADWNRKIAREFYQYFSARDVDGLGTVIDDGYIQHHFTFPDGGWAVFRDLLKTTFGKMNEANAQQPAPAKPPAVRLPYGPVRILTEGNLVWVFAENGQFPAQFNQYTVVNGKLGEHFGTYEDFPQKRLNNNHFHGYGRGPAADFSD